MKTKINTALALIITAALCMTSCETPTTPEELAKRQRYEAIGGRLIAMGVSRNVLTKEEAADIQELGGIVLATKASPVQPVSAEPTTSAK